MHETPINSRVETRPRGRGILASAAFGVLCAFGATIALADDSASFEHARQEMPATFHGPSIPAKPPKNMKVGIVPCAAQFRGCQAPADAAAEAARAIGWSVTMYDGGGTQQKQNASILDAISAGANIVFTIGIDANFIQLALNAAKANGVPIISGSEGTDSPNPILKPDGDNLNYALDVGTDFHGVGAHIAEWIVADSGGKANAVVFADEEFQSAMGAVFGVVDGLKKCAGCEVSPLQKFTASQVGTSLGQQVVGYLQSHPAVDYIYAPYDPAAVVMTNAIVQAGLADKVKPASMVGAAQNFDFIRIGRVQTVDGAFDNHYMGYAMVDQGIRVLNHAPLVEPYDEGTPYDIVDKTNLPAPGAEYRAGFDYVSLYRKLWQ
jgi:ribose transport system substrate-binding protein